MAIDSGAVLLGDIAAELTVGHVGSMTSEYIDEGIPFVRSTDISPYYISWAQTLRIGGEFHAKLRKSTLRPGDVVVVRTGKPGTAAVVTEAVEEANCSDVVIIRPGERLNPWFLVALFNSAGKAHVSSSLVGAVQQHFNVGAARQLEFALPSRDVQDQIGTMAELLTRRIALNHEMNQTLEDIARAVFKSWFIDYDPVHAKARGEPTGLPPEIDALFPSAFKETEEGTVPEGWGVVPLSSQVTVTRGLSYSGAGLGDPGNGVPMHNLNSIYEGGGYKQAGLKWFTGDYKKRHIARPGDVLVANTEQGHDRLLIGYPALVPNAWHGPMIFSHHLYKVDPKHDALLTREFIAYWLQERRTHDLVSGYANGTTVNMLPMDALQMPDVVLPARGLLEAFTKMAQSFHAKMQNNEAQAATLTELRDALLPKLVSGEIQVPVEVMA